MMLGQLALAIVEEVVAPAAVWETLPPTAQIEVTCRIAAILAAIVAAEGERDE
jgi:hypothetical protein